MSIYGTAITTEHFFILAAVSSILFLVAAASAFKSIQKGKNNNWVDENCDIFEFSETLNSNNPDELVSFYNSGIRKATITTCDEKIIISVEMPHRTIFKNINKYLSDIDHKFF